VKLVTVLVDVVRMLLNVLVAHLVLTYTTTNVVKLVQMVLTDLKEFVTHVTITVNLVVDQTTTNVLVVNQTDTSMKDLAHKPVPMDTMLNKMMNVTLVNLVTLLVPLVTIVDHHLVPLVMLQDISITTIVLKSALMDSTTKKNQENVHHVIHLV
jgi:hypothetical protein